jgi:hypothetical protein
MATVMKVEYEEAVHNFRKVQGIKKALIEQIVLQAIAAPYLSSIRDGTTNSLRGTVYELQGKPNPESLYKLRNELKANAQAVTSHLSDGVHGHLALVLSNTQYALLTQQPFV